MAATVIQSNTQPTVGSPTAAGWADIEGANAAILAGATLGRKNALINAVGFPVNQRNAGTVSATGYTVDRWLFTLGSGASSSIVVSVPAPGTITGFSKSYLAWTRATAGTTASTLEQRIESVSTFAGQSATVSILASCASGTVDVTPAIIQNFGTGGSPSGSVTTAGSVITLTSTPTLYTYTFSVPSISGKTLGTTAGTDYLSLQLQRPTSGNGPTVQANIFAVQFELGSAFTGWEVPTIQETLAQCQRYYYRISANATASAADYSTTGTAANTTTAYVVIPLPVPMRVVPTFAVTGTSGLSDRTTSTAVSGLAVTTAGATNTLLTITCTVASGLTAFRPYVLGATVNTGYAEMSADL